MKNKLIDLAAKRQNALDRAEKAIQDGKNEDYTAAMAEVSNLNTEIKQVQDLLTEQQKNLMEKEPTGAEAKDIAEGRAEQLLKGDAVKFSAMEVLRGVRNSVTLATGTLVQPAGAGSTIRDPLGSIPSSIVDQVYVQDLTGMESFSEPYVITELDAKGAAVSTAAGTARTTSADPTFGIAQIKPYELSVTTFVDRNLSRLSPASYYEKIYGMAMKAMRRKLATLIVNGDGQTSPAMFGIKNAKNKAGNSIFSSLEVSTVDSGLLDSFFFAYGSDEAIGSNARLYLTKADLRAIGKIRNTNQERVFKVRPDGGNPNIGVIEDGGVIVPYTIVPGLTSLNGNTDKSSQTMVYGDPLNYELGLFGDYSIRVDESVKALERMVAILGDAMVGGNLIVDKGFVVGTTPAAAG